VNAIDTNVVLRVILWDDPVQSPVATACVEAGVFVSDGVLMETEWVLRSQVKWRRIQVNDALKAFLALATVSIAQPERIAWALDRHRRGADWADMLHLIAARGNHAFITFDADVGKYAGNEPPVPVQVLK
jgi:predicted nucleic-acid-binding protein